MITRTFKKAETMEGRTVYGKNEREVLMTAYTEKLTIGGDIESVLLGVTEKDFISLAKEIEKKGEN